MTCKACGRDIVAVGGDAAVAPPRAEPAPVRAADEVFPMEAAPKTAPLAVFEPDPEEVADLDDTDPTLLTRPAPRLEHLEIARPEEPQAAAPPAPSRRRSAVVVAAGAGALGLAVLALVAARHRPPTPPSASAPPAVTVSRPAPEIPAPAAAAPAEPSAEAPPAPTPAAREAAAPALRVSEDIALVEHRRVESAPAAPEIAPAEPARAAEPAGDAQAALDADVTKLMTHVRLCALLLKRKSPELRLGDIAVEITIAPSGTVSDVRLDAASPVVSLLRPCVTEEARKMAFPPFDGAAARVRRTLSLEGGEQ